MNKILLVAKGEKIDNEKLINSLRRMVIDLNNETIKVIQGNDMEYYKDIDKVSKQSIFMGQITSNNSNDFPGIININNNEFWVFGILDENRVIDSKIIEDNIKEEDRLKVYNNPNLILNYLIQDGEELVDKLLNDYCINGMYSIFDTNSDKPCLYFKTTHNLVGYTGKKDNVSYFSNSKEVMEYLGIEYKTFKRLESVSRFYPKGLNVFSGTFLSYIEKKALKQISEYIPSNELPIEKVNSYIYKFKSKNR